jgi:hypothetical protein
MMLSMMCSTLVGRRVRIVAWEQAHFIASFLERTRLPERLEGTIAHVESRGGGEDVWVQVDGLKREYSFGREQLELLPQ